MKTPLIYTMLAVVLLSSCSPQETTLPTEKKIEEVVFASGTMELENEYYIAARVDGILTDFTTDEGDRIQKGQSLAVLESDIQSSQLQEFQVLLNDSKKNALPTSPQLQNLQSQIDQAKEQLHFDEQQYEKYKALLAEKTVSELDFRKASLQLENAKNNLHSLQQNYAELQNSLQLNVDRNQVQVNTQQAVLKDYQLISSTSGMVINVYKKQGELVGRGEKVLKIGNGEFIIKLFVSEEDITRVELNQTVIVSINTYLDRTFEAKVTKIHPRFDEAEQSYIVEAKFDQLPEKLFSGTQLQANIQTGDERQALLIPTSYLKENKLMLASGEMVSVETGASNDEWTEITSGISAKDEIIKP